MTPAKGSDLDKVVRPLGRGRNGILRLIAHRSSALRALTCAYLTRTPQPGSFPIDTPMNATQTFLMRNPCQYSAGVGIYSYFCTE